MREDFGVPLMLSLGLCQAVRLVLVDYLFHHLVEAIGHALAILLSYLLRSEIGRNECEELLVVSLHEQVYNRVEHIAVVRTSSGSVARAT